MSADATGDPEPDGNEGEEEEEAPTWPAIGLVLAVLWLFITGVALRPMALLGQFLIGLVIGLPIAYLSRGFYWPEADPVRLLGATPHVVVYVIVFLKDLVIANFDVAYRVLSPSMPIEPAVFELPLRVQTDVAITTIANSITLTPGTLTMDYDAGRNALYVHAIDGRDRASIVAPIRRWEDLALVIFDEPLGPDDPVPSPDDGGGAG